MAVWETSTFSNITGASMINHTICLRIGQVRVQSIGSSGKLTTKYRAQQRDITAGVLIGVLFSKQSIPQSLLTNPQSHNPAP